MQGGGRAKRRKNHHNLGLENDEANVVDYDSNDRLGVGARKICLTEVDQSEGDLNHPD